eukprot:TRINITY_DN1308_c0_g1_i1.p1 TRINITY_DN1308_c0_g1~~TRINITY_DN1308_c0_g1_i1.p1  ORF type:complete len:203 (+),score=51.11 TRINITY_DN1308_c0_g1_i1:218-826(+)
MDSRNKGSSKKGKMRANKRLKGKGKGVADMSQADTQLYLDFKTCMLAAGDNVDCYFSLYSHNEQKFITEEYRVQLNGLGMVQDLENMENMKTLFTDINLQPMQSEDKWLVCYLVRNGKLVWDYKDIGPGASSSSGSSKKKKETAVYISRKLLSTFLQNFRSAHSTLSPYSVRQHSKHSILLQFTHIHHRISIVVHWVSHVFS